MGSRYGGLKQLDGLGPNGETIMDYSVYDALRAGFGKIVFVIRKDFEQEFRDKVLSKYKGHIPVEVVFQSIDKLPAGYKPNAERTKPWGTNHAVLMGKDVIKEPFGVINADDYYGADSFKVLADFLRSVEGKKNCYCMVGFNIENTLSENGGVSRGLCEVDAEGFLTGVSERHGIQRVDGKLIQTLPDGSTAPFPEGAPVSMNMWGFTPDYFEFSEREFRHFLDTNTNPLKGEYYIPTAVDTMVHNGEATVKVLDTTSRWFGVTYAADRQGVVDKLASLHAAGVYPDRLF